MNQKKFYGVGAALLICVICAILILTGCSGNQKQNAPDNNINNNAADMDIDNTANTDNADNTDNAADKDINGDINGESDAADEDIDGEFISVNTAEALIEAIQPGAKIVIEPGYYNLSDYMNEVWAQEGEDWNARHEYVEILECFEGVELSIKKVNHLEIRGRSAEDITELVIEPRHGTVMNFGTCSDVKLSNLTMGHTETGYCSGNVVNLYACENIELRDMDLYGCGEVGIECGDGTGDVFVYSSIIHDCSTGPFYIYSGVGKFEFYDCILENSDGGGYYDGAGRSSLSFYRCSFGEQESNVWAFQDNIYAEDCVWSDVGYGEDEYYDYYDIEDDMEYQE